MADYGTLNELLGTIEGMDCLRNNAKQDDGTDTVAGVDWFTFNGKAASSLYVNGNSWVGFGASSEHLKVCRRDGAMWYLYRQEGTIHGLPFLKLRWEGYAQYNQTSETYALRWELFLFGDGGMYLNLLKTPDGASYIGINALVCGGNTYNFTVTAGAPAEYSFFPQDETGSAWSVEAGPYPAPKDYKTFGTAEFQTTAIRAISNAADSVITWEADTPPGTALTVYAKLSGGAYAECVNGGGVRGITPGADLSGETLHVKVELSTSDISVSPVLSGISIRARSVADKNVILLLFAPGNTTSIQNAAGDVTVAYAGGNLIGQGGAVAAFTETFTPVGLVPKPDQNDAEHIEIGVEAVGTLTRVYFTDVQDGGEHIDITGIEAVGTLTHIDDI